MKSGVLFVGTVILVSISGCSQQQAAREPADKESRSEGTPFDGGGGSPTKPSEPPALGEPASDGVSDTAEKGQNEDRQGGKEAPAVVASVCEEICLRVEGSCSAKSAAFCRASCRDYVAGAEKCPIEIEDALRCQSRAEDFLLCSNIAAEQCAPLYRSMKSCREGLVAPKSRRERSTGSGESLPSGWANLTFSGFTVAMPRAHVESVGEEARAEVTVDGIRYRVEPLDTEGRSPSDARILRWATSTVGNDCQPKLRLHGRFETDGVIHVRFDTVCADRSEWHGMLHLWRDRGVVASTFLGPDSADAENPHLEKFLLSFRSLK